MKRCKGTETGGCNVVYAMHKNKGLHELTHELAKLHFFKARSSTDLSEPRTYYLQYRMGFRTHLKPFRIHALSNGNQGPLMFDIRGLPRPGCIERGWGVTYERALPSPSIPLTSIRSI